MAGNRSNRQHTYYLQITSTVAARTFFLPFSRKSLLPIEETLY